MLAAKYQFICSILIELFHISLAQDCLDTVDDKFKIRGPFY